MKKKFINGYTLGFGLALIATVSSFASVGNGRHIAAPSGVSAKNTVALEPARDFKDWRLVCTVPNKSGKKQCQMIQAAGKGEKKSGALITIVRTGEIKKKPVAVMLFMLPLGTLLPPGVALKVDADKEVRLPYQQCRKGGCMVRVAIGKDRLDKIKTAKSMVVGYQGMDGKGRAVPVSLNGFAQALDALWQESSKG